MTLGENRCALGVETVAEFGQPQDFDGSGAIGEPPDEAALLERHNQAMNSGFRAQIERFLHFVEGRRHARLLEALMDEAQELALLLGQHDCSPDGPLMIRRRYMVSLKSRDSE